MVRFALDGLARRGWGVGEGALVVEVGWKGGSCGELDGSCFCWCVSRLYCSNGGNVDDYLVTVI